MQDSIRWTAASPAGLSRAVGGGFTEVVFLGDSTAILYCNANGRSRTDPRPNPRATRFVDDFVLGYAKIDTITGPAIIVLGPRRI